MKNYTINLINQEPIRVTAEQAAKITAAWVRGDHAIVFNGRVFAAHQIAHISPLDRKTEKDLFSGTPPRIEDYLQPKKLK